MTRRMKWLLTILAVLVTALLVDQLILKPKAKIQPAPLAQSRAQPLAANTVNSASQPLLPDATQFSSISKRNLFSPSRKSIQQMPPVRNLPNAQSQPSQSSDAPPDFVITGIAIRPDGGSALIKKGRNEVVRAFVGDEVDGWRVENLTTDYVIISKNGDRWQLPIGAKQ